MKYKTLMIVEAGVLIALAQILSYIKIYQSPYGGSVTAASMAPILIFALRWGVRKGVMAGAVYGVLQFILGTKYSFHVLSILLDYVFAFGVLGVAGLFIHRGIRGALLGTGMGISLRFISHFLSGVLIFGIYAPEGMSPVVYSLIYQTTYLLPELIITLMVVGLLFKPLWAVLEPPEGMK